jgi:hypothetical protein
MTKIRGSGSIGQRHGSADPQHYIEVTKDVPLAVLFFPRCAREALPRASNTALPDYFHIFPEGCERVDTSVPLATARS